jgi:hypothetical protein
VEEGRRQAEGKEQGGKAATAARGTEMFEPDVGTMLGGFFPNFPRWTPSELSNRHANARNRFKKVHSSCVRWAEGEDDPRG